MDYPKEIIRLTKLIILEEAGMKRRQLTREMQHVMQLQKDDQTRKMNDLKNDELQERMYNNNNERKSNNH